ncbi:MAG: hypothetical protein LBG11_11310 [Bifidobacteriaceae bacterium]|nr:hypothetical protein [Bifidobacteriaceae bacterium]
MAEDTSPLDEPPPEASAETPAGAWSGHGPSRRVRVAAVVFALVVVPVFVLVVAWSEGKCVWSWGPQLGPLVNDPLADKELLGLTLVHSSERRGPQLSNLWSFTPASCQTMVDRSFEPGPGGAVATAEDIFEFAKDNGWTQSGEILRSVDNIIIDMSKPYSRSRDKHVTMSIGGQWDDDLWVGLTFTWG